MTCEWCSSQSELDFYILTERWDRCRISIENVDNLSPNGNYFEEFGEKTSDLICGEEGRFLCI